MSDNIYQINYRENSSDLNDIIALKVFTNFLKNIKLFKDEC